MSCKLGRALSFHEEDTEHIDHLVDRTNVDVVSELIFFFEDLLFLSTMLPRYKTCDDMIMYNVVKARCSAYEESARCVWQICHYRIAPIKGFPSNPPRRDNFVCICEGVKCIHCPRMRRVKVDLVDIVTRMDPIDFIVLR